MNSRAQKNLALKASSRDEKKMRLNVTVLPKTSNWLKERGNASQMIDELVEAATAGNLQAADNPSQQLAEVIRENSELKDQLSQLQSQLQKESENSRDYAEVIRENSELKDQLSQLQSQLQREPENHRDYQVIRERVLAGLKLGRQAPGYKSALKALDRFIAEIQ